MKLIRFLLVALIVGAILSPMAAAQPAVATPIKQCTKECDPKEVNGGAVKKTGENLLVILYAHFEDILNRAPLNTQPPDPVRESDLNRGFLMPVVETNTPDPTAFHFKNNEFIMFSSPGLVEFLETGWRTHQEPGLASDARIAANEFNLYWYMSAYAVPNYSTSDSTGQTAKIGATVQMGVYARMETGRHQFKGDVIAESNDWDKNDILQGQRVTMITQPGADDVYEFQVKMNVKNKIIPSSETKNGFMVYVNPYQIKQGGNEGPNSAQLGQESWRVRTGHKFPPRLVIPIENPMETKASSLTIFDNRLFVRWSFVSAWGSYDLRDASLNLKSTGQGKIEDKAIDHIILKRSVDHDGHFKPVNSTWAIDYTNFPLADGDYELTASIMNLQETYQLEQKFPFKVQGGKPVVDVIGAGAKGGAAGAGAAKSGGDDSGIPGFDAAILVAAVAGLVGFMVRRRKA
jgi:hypothetical protein